MDLLVFLILLGFVAGILSVLADMPTKEQREQRDSVHRGIQNLAGKLSELSDLLRKEQREMEERCRNLKVQCDDGIVRTGEEYQEYKRRKKYQ